jgi:hypothetical protein
VPFMKRDFRGRTCAAWLKKRLSIFGCRKREWPGVRDVVTASAGGVCGWLKNRDEKTAGTGGTSAAAPFTKREIRG